MNIKYDTMERSTIPGAWKVWIEADGVMVCVAIFTDNQDAYQWADKVYKNFIVTRSNTVAMEIEDETITQ